MPNHFESLAPYDGRPDRSTDREPCSLDLASLGLAEIDRRLAAGPPIPAPPAGAVVSCTPEEPMSCPWFPPDPWPSDDREPPA